MFNTALLRPRNIMAIVAVTALTHWIARPVYAKVARKDAE